MTTVEEQAFTAFMLACKDGGMDPNDVLTAIATVTGMALVNAPRGTHDVLAERQRQVESEGWTPEHDNEHADGSLALAAARYALAGSSDGRTIGDELDPSLSARLWPRSWHASWWKPKDRRRNLVRAAALLIAEIERLDRRNQT
jgi:hypothetical protein